MHFFAASDTNTVIGSKTCMNNMYHNEFNTVTSGSVWNDK